MSTNKLPAYALAHANFAGQFHNQYTVVLPPEHTYADLFDPSYWQHHHKLGTNDMVRAIAHDNSFDVMVTVRSKVKGGCVMEPWPKFASSADPATVAKAARPTVVPILANGKVRVRIDFVPAVKHRVIALDQSVLSQNHDTMQEAEAARDKYLASLGMRLPTAAEIAAAEAHAKTNEDERRSKAKSKAAA